MITHSSPIQIRSRQRRQPPSNPADVGGEERGGTDGRVSDPGAMRVGRVVDEDNVNELRPWALR